MPPWLTLVLVVVGLVLVVGLQAAAAAGRWRDFRDACRQYSLYLVLLAAPAAVVGLWLFIWR